MSLPAGQGEYREPGLQENTVRYFTGRRWSPLGSFISPPSEGFFTSKKAFFMLFTVEKGLHEQREEKQTWEDSVSAKCQHSVSIKHIRCEKDIS